MRRVNVDVEGFANALGEDIYDPLLSLLKHEDEAVPLLAAQVLTILPPTLPVPLLKTYFQWINTLCEKPHTSMQDLAVQYFAGALKTSRNRLVFWGEKCSTEVVEILKTKKDLQLQYHTLLVVWLIAFETKIAKELNKRHDIIPILVDISKTAIKEKINRLVIGIFRVRPFVFLMANPEFGQKCSGGESASYGRCQAIAIHQDLIGEKVD